MVDPAFKCPRCGSGMNRKSILKMHISKKNICEANIDDLNHEELLHYYNKLGKNHKETPFQCEYCKKYYSNKRSLMIHMNSHTKKDEETMTISVSLLDKLLEGLKIAEGLKTQSSFQTINNNITNTNITNNITLNCFYSPKIDHLEKSFFTDCLLNQDIPTMIERVYYWEDDPQNRSIYMDDNGSYYLYEDGKWTRNSDVIQELFAQGFRFLSGHRRDNNSEIESLMNYSTRNWFDAILDEDEEVVDPIKKDIKLSLSNNKSTLKQKVK